LLADGRGESENFLDPRQGMYKESSYNVLSAMKCFVIDHAVFERCCAQHDAQMRSTRAAEPLLSPFHCKVIKKPISSGRSALLPPHRKYSAFELWRRNRIVRWAEI
jgi:hypothetical protein